MWREMHPSSWVSVLLFTHPRSWSMSLWLPSEDRDLASFPKRGESCTENQAPGLAFQCAQNKTWSRGPKNRAGSLMVGKAGNGSPAPRGVPTRWPCLSLLPRGGHEHPAHVLGGECSPAVPWRRGPDVCILHSPGAGGGTGCWTEVRDAAAREVKRGAWS